MPLETLPIPTDPMTRPAALAGTAGERAVGTVELSIIIVNWNTCSYLRNCLCSIEASLGTLSAEIIVVDNASRDGSAEMVRREFPAAHLIANDANHGFAAGNNQGMRVARGQYLLLLNPDTVVLDEVLERSVAFAEQHLDVAVVGCQVMEDSTTVQRTCFRFPSPLNTLLWVTGLVAWLSRSRLAGRAAYGPWDRRDERDVEAVSGMYMLVRREAIEQVGLMDEAFFVFAEEADWCYRFRQAGWRCVFTPVGRILHVEGGSKSTSQVDVKMYVEMQKNLLLFHRKHLSPASWCLTKSLFATSMVIRLLWWSLWAAVGIGELSRHRARQSAAAAIYHWTGKEPAW